MLGLLINCGKALIWDSLSKLLPGINRKLLGSRGKLPEYIPISNGLEICLPKCIRVYLFLHSPVLLKIKIVLMGMLISFKVFLWIASIVENSKIPSILKPFFPMLQLKIGRISKNHVRMLHLLKKWTMLWIWLDRFNCFKAKKSIAIHWDFNLSLLKLLNI